MEHLAIFDGQQLEAIARVLAATEGGLTGTEIAAVLSDCGIPDIDANNTKWKRLYNAFASCQNHHRVGNHVVMFINRCMNPVRYVNKPTSSFDVKREDLNTVLAFSGIFVGEDGKARRATKANTLDEAAARAGKLRGALESRKVHLDVLSSCRAELLQENYFHAVFEAMKSIASKVRHLSGLTNDGAALVQQAFAFSDGAKPLIALNALATETDRGEQKGFVNLLVGLFGTIRNPLAHNAKAEWDMSEQDALDILTMASLIHRKLDRVHSKVAL